jgi:lipid-A-disaccharide synthase
MFAMANLVAGQQVVPELMQDDFTPDAVATHALALLEEPRRAEAMRTELRNVRAKLGTPGASRRAAEAVRAVAARNGARRLG